MQNQTNNFQHSINTGSGVDNKNAKVTNQNNHIYTSDKESYVINIIMDYIGITDKDRLVDDIKLFFSLPKESYKAEIIFDVEIDDLYDFFSNHNLQKTIKYKVLTFLANEGKKDTINTINIQKFINSINAKIIGDDFEREEELEVLYQYLSKYIQELKDLSVTNHKQAIYKLYNDLDEDNVDYSFKIDGKYIDKQNTIEEFILIRAHNCLYSSFDLLLYSFKDIDLRIITKFLEETEPDKDGFNEDDEPNYYSLEQLKKYIKDNNLPSTMYDNIEGYTPCSFHNIFTIKVEYLKDVDINNCIELWEQLRECYSNVYYEI